MHILQTDLLCTKVPVKWAAIQRAINPHMRIYNPQKFEIPFPAAWRMDLWQFDSPLPKCAKIIFNDPIQQLAIMFTNPEIMFLYRDQVELRANRVDFERGVIGNFMSTKIAIETEDLVQGRYRKADEIKYGLKIEEDDEFSYAIPMKLYDDGVAMGHQTHAKAISVMGSCLNFGLKLQRMDKGKFQLGYIDSYDTVSDSLIVEHLKSKASYSMTQAIDELKRYRDEIENQFRAQIMSTVKDVWKKGTYMYILGVGMIF